MIGKKTKIAAIFLAFMMIFAQMSAFGVVTENYAVEIKGSGVSVELKLTIDDLKAMPSEAQIDEEYIYNSKAGEKSVNVKGISLAYVLKEKAGVTAKNAEVIFTASDNYPIDPQMLEDILNEELKYVLAYEIDGELIDNDGVSDNEEITIYRKVKEQGEFGTVFKMVVSIVVGDELEVSEEVVEDEVPEEVATEDIIFDDITEGYKFAEEAINGLVQRGIINGMGNNKYAPEGSLTRGQIAKIMVEALGYEQTEYKGGFSDVKSSDWFAPYVQTAVDMGIFKGYEDGTFRPENTINRQELAVVAGRGAVESGKVSQEKMAKFVMEKSNYLDKEDVPEWAENQVAWLEAEGVFVNVAAENFEPVKIANRAEAASIIYNTLFR